MNPKKILIVEDTPALAESLRDLLSLEGYDVSVTTSPLDACDSISGFKPDIVITDLIMLKMDGFELTRRLKSLEALKDTPVIIMTADRDKENESKAFSAGAALLFHKPFDCDKLITNIERLLKEGGQNQLPIGT